MKPTDILYSEHRVIEQVLDCLEKIVGRAEADGKLDKQSAQDAVAFFRRFADGCHHAKEESHLFPAMEAKGYPRDGGPVGVMLDEHERGRRHVREMAGSIEGASQGDATALQQFNQHARAYIALLRQHIEKEDHCLFAMADQAFTEEDQAKLLAKFEKVEAEDIEAGTHEKFLQIADELAERYAVSKASGSPAGHGACGCGH